MRKKLDVFGVLIIAFVTSIGGGTLRDILIGNTPVAWLRNTATINVIVVAKDNAEVKRKGVSTSVLKKIKGEWKIMISHNSSRK